jgi:hypothetical protein
MVEPEETAAYRQQLGKPIPVRTYAGRTVEELLDVVFSMRYASYQMMCGELNVDCFSSCFVGHFATLPVGRLRKVE